MKPTGPWNRLTDHTLRAYKSQNASKWKKSPSQQITGSKPATPNLDLPSKPGSNRVSMASLAAIAVKLQSIFPRSRLQRLQCSVWFSAACRAQIDYGLWPRRKYHSNIYLPVLATTVTSTKNRMFTCQCSRDCNTLNHVLDVRFWQPHVNDGKNCAML